MYYWCTFVAGMTIYYASYMSLCHYIAQKYTYLGYNPSFKNDVMRAITVSLEDMGLEILGQLFVISAIHHYSNGKK